MSPAPIPSHRPAARSPRARTLPIALTAVLTAALVAGGTSPVWAAAPHPAVLVGPANGSTASASAPLLQVQATDPDGGSLQVRFEGRRAGATVPSTPGDPFTVVAIPDTQNYTYLNRQGTMTQQTQWVVNTRAQLGTAFAVQLGDLVSEEENLTQWGYTSSAFGVLDAAGMPNSVVPGNHDFDNATGSIHPFHEYFPPSRYQGASWTPSTSRYGGHLGQNQFGPDPIDRGNFDNYSLFTAGGTDFLVLNLEWEAPRYALDWADRVLDAHPDRTVIMATHSFVTVNGTRRTTAERPGGTSIAGIWTDFVSTHCQIRLVLSGHEHNGDAGEARRSDLNSCGQPVHQILTDYQDRAAGGDGWLRYYTFDPAAGTMTATTYSPKLGAYETDADSAFTVPFPLGTQVPAPFTPIATVAAASGSTAQTGWSGLAPGTLYEWRAVVTDGTDAVTSPIWTVRTPLATTPADDTFTRTLASGWGRTDSGHDWTLSSSASSYSVDGTKGRMSVPAGSGRAARLATVSFVDTAISTEVAMTPAATGSGTYVSLMSRLSGSTSYRAKLQFAANGVVNLFLTRFSGTETTLGWQRVPGTFAAGTGVRVAFETSGASPTTVRAKAWASGGTEPAAWLVTATDAAAGLQEPGAVGIDVYQSGSATSTATIAFDRFTATPAGGTPPPANAPPTAVIGTPAISARTVSVSGAGSTDSDGTIAAYAWTFGDGGTASGPTASHGYAADGSYSITLTVTDDDGATASATRSVTVSTPPPVGVLVADDFGRAVSNGWGTADTGGAWSFGSAASRYAVADGTGQHRLTAPGQNADTMVTATAGTSTELRASLAFSRTAAGGTLYASLIPRSVTATTDYRLRVAVAANGKPVLILVRTVGGVETTLGSATLANVTVSANAWYSVAVRAVRAGNATTLTAKLWPRGTAEPGAAQLTATDATAALQLAGSARLNSYESGSATAPITTSWDEVRFTSITP